MAILDSTLRIDPRLFNDEYKHLEYIKEEFNDPTTTEVWRNAGHAEPFGGWMCDMRYTQPTWNDRVIKLFTEHKGWKDVSTSYYRMDPGSSLPEHKDTYKRYIELHNLQGKEQTIKRAVIFLEDWASGHYAEVNNKPYTQWHKGFCIVWWYDTPHLAANMGMTPRYTLQVTGHL